MAKNTKYTREALIASEHFKGYQKDFVSAILVKPEYTLAEAKKVVSAFFNRKEN